MRAEETETSPCKTPYIDCSTLTFAPSQVTLANARAASPRGRKDPTLSGRWGT